MGSPRPRKIQLTVFNTSMKTNRLLTLMLMLSRTGLAEKTRRGQRSLVFQKISRRSTLNLDPFDRLLINMETNTLVPQMAGANGHSQNGNTPNKFTENARLLSPAYIAVDRNGELEVEGTGTWSHLHSIQMAQTAPKVFPSGVSLRGQATMPYKFPPTIHLVLRSFVGSALLSKTSWDDVRVVQEARILLGKDRECAKDLIERFRWVALRSYREAFGNQKEAEID